MEVSARVSQLCACSEFGCVFYHLRTKLGDAKSAEEFKAHIVALIRHIWVASYAQKMTPCIVQAVRECLKPCKETNPPLGSLVQFYNFQLEGKSLPAWIILHSISDGQSEASIRHSLLQIFLDELPLTAAIRDELYLACATTGFNNFFSRVRIASLKQLQARPATHRTSMEIGRGLRLLPYLVETVTVVHDTPKFELKWFVPDMSQRLQSGLAVGIEFVAKGQVWGMYIRTSRLGQWEVILCVLKPSRISLKGTDVHMSFRVSRYDKVNFFDIFNWRSTVKFRLQSSSIEKRSLPVEGNMPKTQRSWILDSYAVDRCRRCINNDGSCYLTLGLVVESL